MKYKLLTGSSLFMAGAIIFSGCAKKDKQAVRPNILWIVAEDMSPDFSCYGDTIIQTPNVDRLAGMSIRYTNAFVTCPVCSPSRSAMVTGMYQTSIGAQNHRSSRGDVKIYLPDSIKLAPEIFREAGYFTANCGYDYHAKTDYNFIWNANVYDAEVDIKKDNSNWDELWKHKKKDQPFFVQLQLAGGKNRGAKVKNPVDPASVFIPPYYPDTELFREDQARYLNSVKHVDDLVGNIMKYLEENGMMENTAIFFITDHGVDNYRDKQYLYEGGIHIPMLLKLPGKGPEKAGTVNNDLVLHIDMVPTSLDLAGIQKPGYLESRSLIAKDYKPRDYVVTARDRCDWTIDRIRSVRTKDFKYIRNYYPNLSYMQSSYRDNWPTVRQARYLYEQGKLDPVQAKYFKPTRPAEELYYLPDDPFEIHNLANNTKYAGELEKLKEILQQWIKKTGDQGQYEESAKSYSEALKNINTGSTLNNFPVLLTATPLEKISGKKFGADIFVTNTSDKTISITIHDPTTSEESQSFTLGQDAETLYYLENSETVDPSAPLTFEVDATYEFRGGSSKTFPFKLNFATVTPYPIPRATTPVSVDGLLNDWADLPYTVVNKDGERKGTFGLSSDSSRLYVAARVDDVDVVSDSVTPPWNSDGIEFRLDFRPDPIRSGISASREFEDHIAVIMSPGNGAKPANIYIPAIAINSTPELFKPGGLSYACRKTAGGFNAEFSVPSNFIDKKQGASWKAIRMNVIIHDKDGKVQKRYTWKPEWGKKGDYVGSGTFTRSAD